MDDRFVWDDETWERVWEQILSPVERHHIAVSVLRRQFPRDPLEGRVALELARRWSRKAMSLIVVYLLWSAFWAAVGWVDPPIQVALGCAAFGLAAIAACLWLRWRMARYVDAHRGMLA